MMIIKIRLESHYRHKQAVDCNKASNGPWSLMGSLGYYRYR